MLRDLFMAAIGALSAYVVLILIILALKRQENAERHSKGVANFMSVEEYEARAKRSETDDEFD